MINKKLILFFSALLALGFIWTIKTQHKAPQQTNNSNKSLGLTITASEQRPSHPLIFYDEKSFLEGVNQAKAVKRSVTYKMIGGITPHHLAVGFILADFYNRLLWQKPTTIILLGPNHYERGNFKALTSLYGWQTPFGIVEPDETIINALIKQDLVRVDENTLPNDHAVAGSMPFIKYYIPDAKVVPILLSGGASEKESEILANRLKDFVKGDVVIIAPVDFSHYLTNKEAQEKDKVTLKVMKDFDYRQLFLMNNDYLDSPPSIGTILMVMQKLGTTHMDLLYHSNSGEIQKNDSIQTTSYFSIAFY